MISYKCDHEGSYEENGWFECEKCRDERDQLRKINPAIVQALIEFSNKYDDLARYQLRDTDGEAGYQHHIKSGILSTDFEKSVRKKYPKEIAALRENRAYEYSFNHGCLATIRYVLGILECGTTDPHDYINFPSLDL